MESKTYERPAMKAVRLQHQGMLMTSDPVGSKASINNWQNGDTTDEGIYM